MWIIVLGTGDHLSDETEASDCLKDDRLISHQLTSGKLEQL